MVTKKQRVWLEEYLNCWNATEAARRAGYAHPNTQGPRLLVDVRMKEEIEARIQDKAMSANEVLLALSEIARGSIEEFMTVDEVGKLKFDFEKAEKAGKLHLIEYIQPGAYGLKVKAHSRMQALQLLGKHHGLLDDDDGEEEPEEKSGALDINYSLPSGAIGQTFFSVHEDIKRRDHTKYVLEGGRGGLKSSFAALVIIEQLKRNPDQHGLVMRQLQNTLRDSVYSQLEWAINFLGLEEEFKCTTSPLQIEYLPTGQIIYFRGGDKPLKIKSIKPKFGYIGILWFEELDQFHGENSIRSIYQSAIRGGESALVLYSYNPPRSKNNWVYKWLEMPDDDRLVHHSSYLDAPIEWIGQAFIREAEHVKAVNPDAYKHEYLGEAVALGGLVFDNLELRKITDEEIEQFDRILHGLDWGYTIDPASYGKMHYDAGQMTLYIFGEYRGWKESNKALYDHIVEAGYDPKQLLIPDSAEPKSIADLRSYGAYARGAEKGPESVRYSMKWLQGIKIVIDPEQCPYHAEEFRNYEYEQNNDGEFISAYPDKDNHAIDDVRYATNLIWRKAGA